MLTDGLTDGRTENRTPISHPATSRCDKNEVYLSKISGVILELSEREKFSTISGFQGEVLVQILDFPIHSIHFHFSVSSRQGENSQLRETFSPMAL